MFEEAVDEKCNHLEGMFTLTYKVFECRQLRQRKGGRSRSL